MSSHESLLPIGTLPLQPVRRLATVASGFIAVTCAASVADLWADWNAYNVVEDYVNGTAGLADLVSADNASSGIAVLYIVSLLVTAIVFLSWLWRARANAEELSPDGHRLRRGWVIGGWLVPVVNLWFPYRVVVDIWRASSPADVAAPNTPVVRWWSAWVGVYVAGLWLRAASRGEVTAQSLQHVAIANTVATLLECLAGVLVILTMRRISQWQSIPRPLPPA